MQPDSACVGFIRMCRASINSSVLPSRAKNSATHTTWVVLLFGILASFFHGFEGVIKIESFLWRLVSVHDGAHRLDHRIRRFALEDVASHVDTGRAFVDGAIGHGKRIRLR